MNTPSYHEKYEDRIKDIEDRKKESGISDEQLVFIKEVLSKSSEEHIHHTCPPPSPPKTHQNTKEALD